MKFFIINYNLPERTEKIFLSLKNSIPETDILILDNGSNLNNPHYKTNFFIEKNLKVTGAYRYIFNYCLNKNINNPIIITTSAILLENENYNEAVEKSLSELSTRKWAVIYSSINSVLGKSNVFIDHQFQISNWIINPIEPQPIFSIWNLEYVNEIKKMQHGWFNENYTYGWGAIDDYQMYNIYSEWNEYVSPYLIVDWYVNSVYVEEKDLISKSKYYNENKLEMEREFKRKFNLSPKKVKKFLRTHRKT